MTYRYRAFIIPYFPDRVKSLFPKLSNYTPLSTFSDQVGAGMTSTDFDIEANINEGDSRMGLDERGTQEVLEIMRRERVKYVLRLSNVALNLIFSSFDQARLIRQNRILACNGIDPSGLLIRPCLI